MTEQYPKIYLYRRIVQAKLFMDAHFSEPIDLDNIADEASFSKFHFIRLFKSIYGKTPHQHLMHVRIEKAKILLQQNTTIVNVCADVGFESVTSFTSLFKKQSGLTPALYQQQQLKRKAEITRSPLTFIPGCFSKSITAEKE
jgi:AraC-like DNA-binding protein